MTAPNKLYKVRVGKSLLHKGKSSAAFTEFHTLQYTDKDTLKGQKRDTQVTLFGSGAVELEFTNESEQRLNCRGLLQPANPYECVLVFDPTTQLFTIEKLTSRGTQLRASTVRTKNRKLAPSSKRSTLIAPSEHRLRSTAKTLPTREPRSAANRRRSALEAAARKLSAVSSQPSPLETSSGTTPTPTPISISATAGTASRSAATGGVVPSSNANTAPSARYAAAATSALPFRPAATTGKDAPLVARLSQSYNESSSSSSESDMDAYNESSSEED